MSLNTIYSFHFNVVDQSNYPSLQGKNNQNEKENVQIKNKKFLTIFANLFLFFVGFYFANTASTDATVGYVTITTPSLTFITDLIYFGTNQAMYGNSITGSSSSISSIHPAADSPNLLTITLTINTSSVTLLIFEF